MAQSAACKSHNRKFVLWLSFSGCRSLVYPVNLRQSLNVASWNVRGLMPKIQDIAESLSEKDITICGLQETKCKGNDEIMGNYRFITFDRENVHHGLGFAVRNNLEVMEAKQVSPRVAFITIKKKRNWKVVEQDQLKSKIHQVRKKKNTMVVINAYAPHMGLVSKDESLAEKFYKDLESTLKKFEGSDCIITGDFNAKLGKQEPRDSCVGSHGRGLRNLNGEFLHKFMCDNNLMASNTFFHHKACHITTWEGWINKKKVYNQIDYILLRHSRKHSMINARSYNVFKVDTDHRLVITKIWMKTDVERNKHQGHKPQKQDDVLKELKGKKVQLRCKMAQTKDPIQMDKLRKDKNRIANCIKSWSPGV